MRGSVKWQVETVYRNSGIKQIGESKHQAKAAARTDGARTPADMGQLLGIYSYRTADAYRDVWKHCLDFAKSEMKLRDIEKLTAEHIQAYLESKIEDGVAMNTFNQYAAALSKLEIALNSYAQAHNRTDKAGNLNSYNFRDAINSMRSEANQELSKFSGSRAYIDPTALTASLSDSKHQVASAIQHEGGLRLHEVALIRDSQLKCLQVDKVTGETRGVIDIKGKGGKVYETMVSKETYQKLERIIQENGAFRIDKDQYRFDLKDAAALSGQKYTGSHGQRWNFARERFVECREAGFSYHEALQEVSRAMGHDRIDITEHYLK